MNPRHEPRYSGGLFGLLSGALLLAMCLWMVRAHWEDIDIDGPKQAAKMRLHEQVLENEAPDPYQYKLWLISLGVQELHERTGKEIPWLFCANTLLALLFLVLVHHLWLRSLVSPPAALLGGFVLGALANVLFLTYFHHAYEFWGIGLFCILLRGIYKDWDWRLLAVLFLFTGLAWEKHALLAALWGLRQLTLGRRFWSNVARGLVMLVCALAVPLLIRTHLGSDREHVDGDTFLHVQEWGKVIWFQLPYLLPFLMILLLRWRVIPGWVRMLWLYLPVLVAAYISQHYILHEVRSFWALAPVFTATLACWFNADVVQRPLPPIQASSSESASPESASSVSGPNSYVSDSTEDQPPSGPDLRPLL
jgi:hypothetical protein